ncbi:MAG: AgmX/PglI C-terminal domain-containing protein [Myxococcota bacterium]
MENATRETPPLWNKGFIGILVGLAVLSGGITYWLRTRQMTPSIKPKNRYAIPIGRPIDKRDWRPYQRSPEHKYIEQVFFPYLNKHQGALKQCYFGYKGAEKRPEKGGKITLSFVIQQDGRLAKLAIFPTTQIKIKAIQDCVLAEVSKWKLKPHKHAPISHQQPFFFR